MVEEGMHLPMQAKVARETRNLAAATGDVSYTGYGFKPTALIFFAVINGDTGSSWGMCDDSLNQGCSIRLDGLTLSTSSALCIYLEVGAGNYQTAVVKSLDADGFTLTWTKTGNPVGTAYINVMALK